MGSAILPSFMVNIHVSRDHELSRLLHVTVQSLSRGRLFVTPWTAARQASLSITNSRSPPKPMSIVLVIPSNHLILSTCPQSFPASGSFPMSQLFTSGGQSFEASASASVLPMNSQGLFPLGLTGLISLQSKGTLKSLLQHHTLKASVLQCTAFFMVQLSYPYMTTGKNIALTIWTLSAKWCLWFLLLCLGLSCFSFQRASIF